VKVQLEPKERSWGGGVRERAPLERYLKFGPLKMHFCIQVANVDLDAVVLPDATATSGVSNYDASPKHIIELSAYFLRVCVFVLGSRFTPRSQATHSNCF